MNVVNSHEALTDVLKLSNMFDDADHKCFVRRRQCNSERKEVTRHDSTKCIFKENKKIKETIL